MAKAQGQITRGTTNPNRLRRIDRWVNHQFGALLRSADDPLLVDLGYGAYSVTTREWWERVKDIRRDAQMVGVEIDPQRVKQAQSDAQEGLSFILGGFEIPTQRAPLIIRAFNVLRQYQEHEVHEAWTTMTSRLQPHGVLIEGTCDELGRIAAWVTLHAHESIPRTLTFACDPQRLEKPSQFAQRLPKILIHHNVAGESIHQFLQDWDKAWNSAAPWSVFGARQRWLAAVRELRGSYNVDAPSRMTTVTIPWGVVSP